MNSESSTNMELHSHQAVRDDGHSSPVIEDIFSMHFPGTLEDNISVLDLTWGRGNFWDWDWKNAGICLGVNAWTDEEYEAACKYRIKHQHSMWMLMYRTDFTEWFTDGPKPVADIVVFDPPFTSSGTASDGGKQALEFGADRNHGGPKNLKEVQLMFSKGLATTLGLARVGAIVKMQGMVESRKYWPTHSLVYEAVCQEYDARPGDWYVADEVYVRGNRRPQPKGRKIEHFHSKPAIYFVLKRKA